jgi:hypothetical protein
MGNRSAEIERTTERMKKQGASKEAIIAAVERINKRPTPKAKKKSK